MAYETEYANLVTATDAISALMSPAFVNNSILMNLVYAENFPANTKVIKLRKDGSVTAETLNESTAYTPSASSELTENGAVTLSAVKGVVVSELTVEAQRFGGSSGDLQNIANKHGAALGRLFDASTKTLFSSLSNSVTASTTLAKDNLLDAQYYVFSSIMGAADGMALVAVLDYKGVNEIRKEITSSTGTAFSNLELLDLVRNAGVQQNNHLAGQFAGMEIYQTSGLPTATSDTDDVGAVFHPRLCFGAGFGGEFVTKFDDPRGSNGFVTEVSSYMFYDVEIWNNTAGCKVLSNT